MAVNVPWVHDAPEPLSGAGVSAPFTNDLVAQSARQAARQRGDA
jgi:hypothetical protein